MIGMTYPVIVTKVSKTLCSNTAHQERDDKSGELHFVLSERLKYDGMISEGLKVKIGVVFR